MKIELIYHKDDEFEYYLIRKNGWVHRIIYVNGLMDNETAKQKALNCFNRLIEKCKSETTIIKSEIL